MNVRSDLEAIVGLANVKDSAADKETYGRDWTKAAVPNPSFIVLPATTAEVSQVMTYCYEHNLAVVPSGGRTGLAGAAVAANGEIVVAMDRMNKVLKVDDIGMTIEVEAGATTQSVQEAAKAKNLFFALDLAAKGSSQIGGNIATNAGGTKLIRYGGMREQVLGLEVVLANGTILDMNTSIRKNNTGYDLKQLFIGSEGTLGLVTKATLRLMPQPKDLQLMCMGIPHITEIPKVLQRVNQLGIQPTAFEFFSQKALDLCLKYHPGLRMPLAEQVDYYVLLEVENHGQAEEQFTDLCELLFEDGTVTDAVVNQSTQQFHDIWALRENISESISTHGHVRKNDISVPIDQLSGFIENISDIISKDALDIELILFGHIGDGNVHINYVAPFQMDLETFKDQARRTERKIFDLLPEYKGSISAEHGIGLLKKKDLILSRSELEINLMKEIRKVFDGRGILNPGKIF